MHTTIPGRVKIPTSRIPTSPTSQSPARAPTTLPNISTMWYCSTNTVRPAHITDILSAFPPPRSFPPDFRLNYTPQCGDLGASLRHQTDGSLICGDGGRAPRSRPTRLLPLTSSAAYTHSATLPHPSARHVDRIMDTCRTMGWETLWYSASDGRAIAARCFADCSKPAEWR